MILYPAIDIMDGRCVRLSQGDFNTQKVYSENPADMALSFQQAGLKHLHLVDLDGAKQGTVKNWDVIQSITQRTTLIVDFGGGVKTESEISRLLDMGISQINLGSIAHREPEKVASWIQLFGSEKIILSADASRGKLAVSGWQSQTEVSVIDYIKKYIDLGIQYATVTDISKDGMMSGPGIELYTQIIKSESAIKLIASGGVQSWSDVDELAQLGCYGCIIGKAIYEGNISLTEIPLSYL